MLSYLTAQAIEPWFDLDFSAERRLIHFPKHSYSHNGLRIDGRIAQKKARTEVELLLKAISSLKAKPPWENSHDVLQLPPLQSQWWQMKRMLHGGISQKGKQVWFEHDVLRWSGVHASDFNPGSVT